MCVIKMRNQTIYVGMHIYVITLLYPFVLLLHTITASYYMIISCTVDPSFRHQNILKCYLL